MKFVPLIGSPPMPTQVALPHAGARQLVDDLVRERAERLTTPMLPGVQMRPGMMPTLDLPG